MAATFLTRTKSRSLQNPYSREGKRVGSAASVVLNNSGWSVPHLSLLHTNQLKAASQLCKKLDSLGPSLAPQKPTGPGRRFPHGTGGATPGWAGL